MAPRRRKRQSGCKGSAATEKNASLMAPNSTSTNTSSAATPGRSDAPVDVTNNASTMSNIAHSELQQIASPQSVKVPDEQQPSGCGEPVAISSNEKRPGASSVRTPRQMTGKDYQRLAYEDPDKFRKFVYNKTLEDAKLALNVEQHEKISTRPNPQELIDFINLTGPWSLEAYKNGKHEELRLEKADGNTNHDAMIELYRTLMKTDTKYEFNEAIPGLFDESPSQKPKVSLEVLEGLKQVTAWRKANRDACRTAEDPDDRSPVPKDVCSQLVLAEQLERTATRQQLSQLHMFAIKQHQELLQLRLSENAYKALLNSMRRFVIEFKAIEGIQPLTAFMARPSNEVLDYFHQATLPETPITAPSYDDEQDAETNRKQIKFAKDDPWNRRLELRSMVKVTEGKAALQREQWTEAIQLFVQAKAVAALVGFSPLVQRVCLWQGIAWMGLNNLHKAEKCFWKARHCFGTYREGSLASDWIAQVTQAKESGVWTLWGKIYRCNTDPEPNVEGDGYEYKKSTEANDTFGAEATVQMEAQAIRAMRREVNEEMERMKKEGIDYLQRIGLSQDALAA